MIKGSIEERMEYEDYIHSLKDTIRFPFWSIYQDSQKIIRYYWIKKAKENRDFMPDEIQILHLLALIDVAVRIGGLLYTWWWEEYLPKVISMLPPSKAEWYVSPEDIAQCFMNVPTKTVEAALLKTNASNEIVKKTMEAQRSNNRGALVEQLSCVSLDELFGAYKLINAYRQQCEIISEMTFADRKTLFTITDAFEVMAADSSFEMQRFVEKLTDLARTIELDEENFLDNPEPFIFALCISIQLIAEVANDRLGKCDPITETLQDITEETAFRKIYHHYVQFPRDIDRCLSACGKFIRWINENLETNISLNELEIEHSKTNIFPNASVVSTFQRLEFPTRISRNRPMDLTVKEKILIGLYEAFGSSLEDIEGNTISKAEFIYLFDGPGKRPENYRTPYYWNKSDKQFAGLLRLLYLGQPSGINKMILMVADKDIAKSRIKWSTRKQGLGVRTLRPIEEQIQSVVFTATGSYLTEVDLTKQNKPKNKKDEETRS